MFGRDHLESLYTFLGGKFAEEKLSKEQLPRKEKLRFLVPVTAKPSMKLTLYIVPLQYMADSSFILQQSILDI